MLELEFTAADLARTRFALSPLWEVVASVRVLKRPAEHPLLRPWSALAGPALAASGVDWGLLSGLVPVPTRLIPGFVCPPPSTPVPDLGVELATLRATPPEAVREGVDALPAPRTAEIAALRENPGRELGRLADGIAHYWDVALAPHWPRIRTLLESDVLHRARRLAEGGTQRLFDDLDPQVSWEEGTLRLAHRHVSGVRGLGGRGLLLVPSAFIWPRIFSVTSLAGSGGQPALRYPPRAVGTLWQPAHTTPSEALAQVLGRSRATLLAELESPECTTELARRSGLSPGGVSQHLKLLHAAGLVSAHRAGHRVLYARTVRGEALLTG
ncbi:ArsR family transcriptional regulator [Streptomyces sp. N2-109]|uniref:ArsR family transcriptional regulator n=1 Tax=Streptomyces gossypii TaxID=2883101 RepID=A0ABT2JRR6_9ACTN|nr:ArsR family transcriptional regulator [Streptomyces gossypii]MCT2590582.1 ArsR family transcriptional regulator [Streptomyces gossypii]